MKCYQDIQARTRKVSTEHNTWKIFHFYIYTYTFIPQTHNQPEHSQIQNKPNEIVCKKESDYIPQNSISHDRFRFAHMYEQTSK